MIRKSINTSSHSKVAFVYNGSCANFRALQVILSTELAKELTCEYVICLNFDFFLFVVFLTGMANNLIISSTNGRRLSSCDTILCTFFALYKSKQFI